MGWKWIGQLAVRWTLALDRQLQLAYNLALRIGEWYNDDNERGFDIDYVGTAIDFYDHDHPAREYYFDNEGRLYHYQYGRKVYYHYADDVKHMHGEI